jgi:hypothetical protein
MGCPHPECTDLKMEGNFSRVIACTTQDFDGFVANIRPGGFATRFVGLEKSIPGFYALTVRGEIPPEVQLEDMLEAEEKRKYADDVPSLADSSDDEDNFGRFSSSFSSKPSSAVVTPVGTPKVPAVEARSSNKDPKKRKVTHPNVGKPQPGSTGSTSSDASQIRLGKSAMNILGDLLSDSDAEPGTPKSPDGDKSDARSSKDDRQVVASGSEAGSAKPASSQKESSHGTAASSRTEVSKASVAILEADEDTEFRGAPE